MSHKLGLEMLKSTNRYVTIVLKSKLYAYICHLGYTV